MNITLNQFKPGYPVRERRCSPTATTESLTDVNKFARLMRSENHQTFNFFSVSREKKRASNYLVSVFTYR